VRDTPIVVAVLNIGFTGVAAGTDVTILDQVGLVDREVARNPVNLPAGVRGRPGHEDKLTLELCVELGVQICRTPFPRFDSVMATPFGAIITLDPAFLRFFPERVRALQAFQRDVSASATEEDRRVAEFLDFLERRYAVRIEDLPVDSDPSGGRCVQFLALP
jgi:hypothetical protein